MGYLGFSMGNHEYFIILEKIENMIQIAHEAPKSIFREVAEKTDYVYALVHLFEEDPEYYNLFVEAKKAGKQIILDNSIFELGNAFDPEKFLFWVNRLEPDYYIVPDVLENCDGTINNMVNWIKEYKPRVTANSKVIGVVQGRTYLELEGCYAFMDQVAEVDRIAISFDYSFYEKSHPDQMMSWVLGRVKLLNDLRRSGVLNTNKEHHLLGCALPGEGIFYRGVKEFECITSMDTSNPVVHGMLKTPYDKELGLHHKDRVKLFTMINAELDAEQKQIVFENIEKFRNLWNGDR